MFGLQPDSHFVVYLMKLYQAHKLSRVERCMIVNDELEWTQEEVTVACLIYCTNTFLVKLGGSYDNLQ
jgi:hypothetical protein